jgi:transposase InsO family protein
MCVLNRNNLASLTKAAVARNLAPLELIHSDLCEMNGELTKGGKRYFMIFIDDCTRFCYVYFLKSKDEALHYFKIYKAEVENQLERKIKRSLSDCGGEYFSNDFSELCAEHGIIHERTLQWDCRKKESHSNRFG